MDDVPFNRWGVLHRLQAMRLSQKLPLLVALICTVLAFGLTAVTDRLTRAKAIENAQSDLLRAAETKANQLELWEEDVRTDLVPLRASPATIEAVQSLRAGWMAFPDAPQPYLQKTYVTENPHAAAARSALDRGVEPLVYNFQHAKFHPYLRNYQEVNQYRDLLLLTVDGHIMYSVQKGNEFATNVTDPALAETGLADVFSRAVDGPPGEIHFSQIARYGPNGGQVTGFAATSVVSQQGDLIGVLAVQLETARIDEIMQSNNTISSTFLSYVVAEDGRLRSNPGDRAALAILDPAPATSYVDAALRDDPPRVFSESGLNGLPVMAAAVPFHLGNRRFAVVAEDSEATILLRATELRNKMILLSVAATVLASLLGWFIVRNFSGAIARLRADMLQMSDGNYDVVVADATRHDEIGGIGRTLIDFRDRLRAAEAAEVAREEMQQELEGVVAALSDGLVNLSRGDLTQPISQPFHDDYEKLRADYNLALEQLQNAMIEVAECARSVKHGAVEISAASDDLSTRTETQAATLEQTATALDELTESVKSAADGARSVEEIMAEARSDAEKSGEIVKTAVAAMSEIEASSSQISQIIGVIEDIAFQTNLLALNAGVEAARAGEAGKGFAVVASEVRALAQRSSEAANEIKTLIGGSTRQVERGVALVDKTGEALTHIVDRVSHIARLMSDMATAATEQAAGLNEINIGVTQLDSVTQQNAAMVEQSTAASHTLRNDADRLAELMDRFETNAEIGEPMVPVRALTGPLPDLEPEAEPSQQPRFAAQAAANGEPNWQDF